jgi:aminoglycoside 3-N-acetyltransferase
MEVVMNNNLKLFKDNTGNWITYNDVVSFLKKVGADKCDILFIHTETSFGIPNAQFKRKEYLELLYSAILELKVKTIIFPSFSFSFCNNEKYNVSQSRSRMGALNEYVRCLTESIRSIDPILSVTVVGQNKEIIKDLGKNSIGKDSIFDRLHKNDNVKFLFFGAEIAKCFTYIHYVEEQYSVPYRYNREFKGIINDGVREYEDIYTLYVKYKGIVPAISYNFEQHLFENGSLKRVNCGNSPITCISEKDAHFEIINKLNSDINYFLDKPFVDEDLEPLYIPGNIQTV